MKFLFDLGSNLILKDKKLSIQAKEPLLMLDNSLSGRKDKGVLVKPKISDPAFRQTRRCPLLVQDCWET
jgi:hypothetical protein